MQKHYIFVAYYFKRFIYICSYNIIYIPKYHAN